ncbi:hypothetical protein PPO43_15725 [Saprospira sp. CCB-QB6]|uniref:hypothetical protein n=1 Tax=Saprospira sp. CCB-QB6 TaxID=3023936 RepID=UPI00234A7EBD|nr:hypothetical protein [Saprospira sp. CCB-QB6]WCL81425.1 hypothetical protein PPO43_15725 [Saprospira sp. CCB-QB6]
MIPVQKEPLSIPAKLSSESCLNNRRQIIGPPINKGKISAYYYGDTSVKEKLNELYHNKCAYCESLLDGFDIEHYRPKKEVTENTAHPGYYWLAYEWTNLLPACISCNQRQKRNHFPVNNSHKTTPSCNHLSEIIESDQKLNELYLSQEVPLLLHPEEQDFDPFDYFDFNLETAAIIVKKGLKKTDLEYKRADATIKIIGLDRDYLKTRRANIIIALFDDFLFHLSQLATGKIQLPDLQTIFYRLLAKLESNSQVDKEYAFFWQYLKTNALYLINLSVNNIIPDPRFQNLLIQRFQKWLEEYS